jgi:hypothetical protein
LWGGATWNQERSAYRSELTGAIPQGPDLSGFVIMMQGKKNAYVILYVGQTGESQTSSTAAGLLKSFKEL